MFERTQLLHCTNLSTPPSKRIYYDRAKIQSLISCITSFVISGLSCARALSTILNHLSFDLAIRTSFSLPGIMTRVSSEPTINEKWNLDTIHRLDNVVGSRQRIGRHPQERRRHRGFLNERIGPPGLRPTRISECIIERRKIRSRNFQIREESSHK